MEEVPKVMIRQWPAIHRALVNDLKTIKGIEFIPGDAGLCPADFRQEDPRGGRYPRRILTLLWIMAPDHCKDLQL